MLSKKPFTMLHPSRLAQKSSEGRVSLARRSIGFFALFWFIFWVRSGTQAKKNKKAGSKSNVKN
jgi:hypothetical protein